MKQGASANAAATASLLRTIKGLSARPSSTRVRTRIAEAVGGWGGGRLAGLLATGLPHLIVISLAAAATVSHINASKPWALATS